MLNDVILIGNIIEIKEQNESVIIDLISSKNLIVKNIHISKELIDDPLKKDLTIGIQGSIDYDAKLGNFIIVERYEIINSNDLSEVEKLKSQ